jgi:Asp-tRNA(Asn)/Glu-tRNA(Gln) amidotransferase A subunit family amidase
VIGSAADIVRQISTGARSAASVLAETKALIHTRNRDLNCFTATTFERAQREAAAIDALQAQGVGRARGRGDRRTAGAG